MFNLFNHIYFSSISDCSGSNFSHLRSWRFWSRGTWWKGIFRVSCPRPSHQMWILPDQKNLVTIRVPGHLSTGLLLQCNIYRTYIGKRSRGCTWYGMLPPMYRQKQPEMNILLPFCNLYTGSIGSNSNCKYGTCV